MNQTLHNRWTALIISTYSRISFLLHINYKLYDNHNLEQSSYWGPIQTLTEDIKFNKWNLLPLYGQIFNRRRTSKLMQSSTRMRNANRQAEWHESKGRQRSYCFPQLKRVLSVAYWSPHSGYIIFENGVKWERYSIVDLTLPVVPVEIFLASGLNGSALQYAVICAGTSEIRGDIFNWTKQCYQSLELVVNNWTNR